jgi:DNA-binding NarL/FixJ family response regulator
METTLTTTHLYLIDDHPYMREVLGEFLGGEPGLAICGEAASGEEALAGLPSSGARVALVDLSLPDMSGVELIRTIGQRHPDVLIVVLSGHKSRGYVDAALAAGAHGYVLKDDVFELPAALREMLDGRPYLSSTVQRLAEA